MSEVDQVEGPNNDEAEVDARTRREKLRDVWRRTSKLMLVSFLFVFLPQFLVPFGLTYVQMYTILATGIVCAILSLKE